MVSNRAHDRVLATSEIQNFLQQIFWRAPLIQHLRFFIDNISQSAIHCKTTTCTLGLSRRRQVFKPRPVHLEILVGNMERERFTWGSQVKLFQPCHILIFHSLSSTVYNLSDWHESLIENLFSSQLVSSTIFSVSHKNGQRLFSTRSQQWRTACIFRKRE
jgi:hypothetical protein